MKSDIVDVFERQNDQLAKLFRELSNRNVYYFPNHGNAGDSLIAAATYQLLKHYNIKYGVRSTTDEALAIKDSIILLGGGGNLVPLYKGMAALVRAATKGNNHVVLMPHSVRGHADLLAGLPNSMTVYCREEMSFQHARSLAKDANVILGHDLGLYADMEKIESEYIDSDARKNFAELLAQHTKLTPLQLEGRKVSCIRGGGEATIKAAGPNYDISVIFKGAVTPGKAELSAWMLFEFTRLAGEVMTNRLHVGIAAALAKTPTRLYDNNYGKLSGVYVHSMQERFPYVKFEGEMLKHDPYA